MNDRMYVRDGDQANYADGYRAAEARCKLLGNDESALMALIERYQRRAERLDIIGLWDAQVRTHGRLDAAWKARGEQRQRLYS